MIKSNYHTHTYLCKHAEGLPEDYIKRAIELGYEEIGISDHAPILDERYRMSEEEYKDIYIPNLEKSILKYQNKIKIYKGLEVEYFSHFDDLYKEWMNELDFFILGQHVIGNKGNYESMYSDMTAEKIIRYAETVAEALDSKMFKILAHPEIFCFSYHKWDDVCTKASHIIIQAAIKSNCLLELNVNGLRQKRVIDQNNEEVWRYPRKEFFEITKQYPEAKIIINDDAHYVAHLNDKYTKKVYKFAQELNLNIVYTIND